MKKRSILTSAMLITLLVLFISSSLPAQALSPEQSVRASTAVIARQVKNFVSAQTTGKTYADSKKGYALTLPTGWKKSKPDEQNMWFLATRGTTAQWFLTADQMNSTKEATDMQKYMTANPKAFAKLVMAELKKQFGSCVTSSARKTSMGTKTGAQAVFQCTSRGQTLAISFFSFTRGKRQFSAVALTAKSQYSSLRAEFDGITKSLTFTK